MSYEGPKGFNQCQGLMVPLAPALSSDLRVAARYKHLSSAFVEDAVGFWMQLSWRVVTKTLLLQKLLFEWNPD